MAVDWASSLDLLVDQRHGEGLRRGIEDALRAAIRDGRLPLGARLPSSRALAHDLGVARGTVSAAYDQLAAEGYLSLRQGAAGRVSWVPAGPPEPRPATVLAEPAWDLRPGRADRSSFPRQAWLRSVRRVVQEMSDGALDYGPSQGDPRLRAALAEYLGRVRGVRVGVDDVVVCTGFTQAFGILCRTLRRRGATRIAMEDPNGHRYRDIAIRAGLEVVPVPCDDRGLRVDELADADAVLITPAHQYPLGVTLSPQRRSALIEWARHRDALIIEDDYDGEFRFDRSPVGAVQQMDPSRVVYAGTASKTLAPGLRLGWLATPPVIRHAVIDAKEDLDRGSGVLDQLVFADLIESGEYDRHVRRMRGVYRTRRDELVAALAHHGWTVPGIAAGLHALIPLPDKAVERRVLAAAHAKGLMLNSLADYWHRPVDSHPRAVVVGYGTPAGHAFRPTLGVLLAVLST